MLLPKVSCLLVADFYLDCHYFESSLYCILLKEPEFPPPHRFYPVLVSDTLCSQVAPPLFYYPCLLTWSSCLSLVFWRCWWLSLVKAKRMWRRMTHCYYSHWSYLCHSWYLTMYWNLISNYHPSYLLRWKEIFVSASLILEDLEDEDVEFWLELGLRETNAQVWLELQPPLQMPLLSWRSWQRSPHTWQLQSVETWREHHWRKQIQEMTVSYHSDIQQGW